MTRHQSISLIELLDRTSAKLLVPAFQRRYVWGQTWDGHPDAALVLMRDLCEAYLSHQTYYLQGITLAPHQGRHMLIDGQQRMVFLKLLLHSLGYDRPFSIAYESRPQAEAFMDSIDPDAAVDTQDIHYFKHTLAVISTELQANALPHAEFLDYVLRCVRFLLIQLDTSDHAISAFKMMNGTKAPLSEADLIKAELLHHATSAEQLDHPDWELSSLRNRYAQEWESWLRWWLRPDTAAFFEGATVDTAMPHPLDTLLALSLGSDDTKALTHSRFCDIINEAPDKYHGAKEAFMALRHTQKKCEETLADPRTYNMVKAILLLQEPSERMLFMRRYFCTRQIDDADLERHYMLSFLGMTTTEIIERKSAEAKFDELLASLSMADVYHTEAKRDAFNLLLRLNIDEDIKLGRKFDFTVWSNRSLEHIYSKSKVWHEGATGKLYDGNDNELRLPRQKLENDPTYMRRDDIVNLDGLQLSEHCIGNLVLLYGDNNAAFGNSGFERKKEMFLDPGKDGVFQSRNLLHSVCVFAGNEWTSQSIIDNYNLTLKNLKLRYGYK